MRTGLKQGEMTTILNQETKCSPTAAIKVVDLFLQRSNPEASLLVVGPSGSGKTTLVLECARRNNVSITKLSPCQLSDGEVGIVECNILRAFTTAMGDNGTTHVVFIDDIDIWAPALVLSTIQNRIIATLNDVIQSLNYSQRHEHQSHSARFIATASSISSVHPCLIRDACVNRIIALTALSHTERKSWCLDALKFLYPQPHLHKSLPSVAHRLASMTPGFVHADMLRFFSLLSQNRFGSKFPTNPSYLLQSSILRQVSRSCTPLLMSHLNPLLASISSLSIHTSSLYGLQQQLIHLKQCLKSCFYPPPEDPFTELSSIASKALKNIRNLTGILIHGPTGCGKSALVQHATRPLPDNSVNILPVDSASIVSSVIGQAERNLTSVFSVAREIAPAVVIIENIDLLVANRDYLDNDSSSTSEAFSRLLSTLLIQVDGLRNPTADAPPVLVIATTTCLNLLDPALLRPGRIDVHIEVRPPNKQSRLQLLHHIWTSNSFSPQRDFNESLFEKQSEGWTAADVQAYAYRWIWESTRAIREPDNAGNKC